jgi:hypothetical protein
MSNELERIWKKAIMAWSRYSPCIFLEGLRTNSVRITVLDDGIWTEHLPNTI